MEGGQEQCLDFFGDTVSHLPDCCSFIRIGDLGDLGRVEELLNVRKRDPNERDLSDYTPLHYAARHGHVQVCGLLLRKRAAVDARAGEAAATPLHRACAGPHVEVIATPRKPRAPHPPASWHVNPNPKP